MDKNLVINELANELSTKVMTRQEKEKTFEKLYLEIYPMFDSIVRAYIIKSNLTGFNFDLNDYISILGQSMMECIEGYSMAKGDFIARLRVFAYKRFKNVTEYNLAEKRFNKKKRTYSFGELPDSAEYATEDVTNSEETPRLICNFVKNDKDGELIKILYTYSSSVARRQALMKYFGGEYNAAARKRVQRVRERLNNYLGMNGVSI